MNNANNKKPIRGLTQLGRYIIPASGTLNSVLDRHRVRTFCPYVSAALLPPPIVYRVLDPGFLEKASVQETLQETAAETLVQLFLPLLVSVCSISLYLLPRPEPLLLCISLE